MMREYRLRSSLPGFTLLEVVVAVSLVGIAILAVLKLQGQTLRLARMNRFHTEAPLLAEVKLAEVLSPETIPESASGEFGELYPGYAYRIDVETPVTDFSDSVAARFRKIDLTIILTEDQWTYALTTYRVY